jgi:hypothetical protein
VNIQSLRNYTEDASLGAILVQAPITASRGQAKVLNRGGGHWQKLRPLAPSSCSSAPQPIWDRRRIERFNRLAV